MTANASSARAAGPEERDREPGQRAGDDHPAARRTSSSIASRPTQCRIEPGCTAWSPFAYTPRTRSDPSVASSKAGGTISSDEREPEATHGPHEVEAVGDDSAPTTASGTTTYWMRAKTAERS